MERKLAYIARISQIEPHTNADNLEIAQVGGFKSIIQKGSFKAGDFVVYVETDSLLPKQEWNQFLFKKPEAQEVRIKTIRLRGVISQGVIFPRTILPEYVIVQDPNNEFNQTQIESQYLIEGADVTNILNIKLWVEEVPAQLKGKVKGVFPGFLIKTDQPRLETDLEVLKRNEGVLCWISEKLDGTSVTFYYRQGEFGVCSRNLELFEDESLYWRIAKEYNIKELLSSLGLNIAIQGEIFGLGVQKNRLKLNKVMFRVFDVFSIDQSRYYNYNELLNFSEQTKLELVPIINSNYVLHTNSLEDFNDELPKITSVFNNQESIEGVVIKPKLGIKDYDFDSPAHRLSFKIINKEYLLKHAL